MDPDAFLPKLNKTATRYLEKVQDDIHYCIYCQPCDDGDYVWILGDQIELTSLLSDNDVPEKYWDDIASHLKCPNCGRSGFEIYEDVGLEDSFVFENRKIIEAAEKKYGKSIDRLNDHIKSYPSLVLRDPLGKKIFNEIISSKIPEIKISGSWYRSRIVKDNTILESCDLGAPEHGKTSEGRYNRMGQDVLYLSNGKDVSYSEVLEDYFTKSLIWLQEFEVKDIDKILDLRNDWESLGSLESSLLVAIMAKRIFDKPVEDRSINWKHEYYITQFVADCARLAGYRGICYTSTRGFGDNVVLFNWDDKQLTPVSDPEIVMHNPTHPFMKLKNKIGFDF